MAIKNQGQTLTIETVQNGFIIRAGKCAPTSFGMEGDTCVARTPAEAKIVLRNLFNQFVEGLELSYI